MRSLPARRSVAALRLRLLAAIGASGLAVLATEACGASSSTPQQAGDAAADGATPATGDAGAETSATPTPEAAADAPAEAMAMSVRRPLLVGASLRSSSVASRGDWAMPLAKDEALAVDARTRAALAQAWAADGCEEHASIAAFARLTLHLLALGAPSDLVERAHLASLDEVRHARACFALAGRYGDAPVGPGPLALHGLFAPTGGESAVDVASVAALCAEEGCVGETLGALLAEETLARTTDPTVRAILERLVAEEEAHADLAWRVLRFCVDVGGEPAREAARRAFERGIRATRAVAIRRYDGVDVGAWNAHGRVTCEQAREVAERGIREVVEPCALALLGGVQGAGGVARRDVAASLA